MQSFAAGPRIRESQVDPLASMAKIGSLRHLISFAMLLSGRMLRAAQTVRFARVAISAGGQLSGSDDPLRAQFHADTIVAEQAV